MKKFIATLLLATLATGAVAHSRVDTTTPKNGTTVDEVPAGVGLDEPATEGASTVARLPVHGPWRGSLNGSVARLTLDGPTGGLSGWLSVGDERGRVVGRYIAAEQSLVLDVAGPGDAAGTWTLLFHDGRLDGRVSRAGSADVFAVHLAPGPTR